MNTERLPSRVLMTADTIGGVWTFAIDLCAGLADHGVDVQLATMGAPAQPAQRRQAEKLGNVTLRESTFALEWMDDPWVDVARAGEWLWSLAQDFQPDVVHLNGFTHASLPWDAPVVVTAHSCVLSWWRAVKQEPIPAPWKRYEAAVRAGLRAASWITAPTRWMADELVRNYGPLDNISTITNGSRVVRSAPCAKEPFVLSVGRAWDEAKNIGALDPIAADLPWPIRVAGNAIAPDGARSQYPNLHMLGALSADELSRWYKRAPIFALPAKYEPFGLSVLEAAAARCALVLGDIPSLRETWNGAAEFVPPGDGPALRAALLRLMNESDRREELADAAARRASIYSADTMTSRYLDLYQRLTAAPFPRPDSVASTPTL